MAHKNAARVLPVPVGAHTSVWSPAAMAGQPSAWGGVGAAKADANQARVGSENAARGSATTPPPYRPPATPAAPHPSVTAAALPQLLRSLARNTGSEARNSTLAADVEPEPLHRHTVRSYLETLRRLFVVEEQPAWSVRLRSRALLRRSPKRHLADPSLAAAALGADPGRLMADASTLGLLFESLVVRDLRILAQPLGGRVFHLRDTAGLVADAIVEFPDGRWLAVEAKLGGGNAIDAAAQSLSRLTRKVSAERTEQLAALVVITAVGYGYTRPDGVRVAP